MRVRGLGTLLSGVAVSTLTAMAMPAAVQAQGQSGAIEEVIVTATRREQSLQEVPIAVAAYSEELLTNAGVDDIQEVMNLSPSFQASTNVSETQGAVIRMRGVGTQGNNPAFESAVGVFIDGVYRARAGIALAELLDISRIEVLRGPQGTLFGRNTTAGALNVVTQAPSHESEIRAEALYGNLNEIEVRGTINGTLIPDKLAGRLSAFYLSRDGIVDDLATGRKLDDKNRYKIKGQLLYTPSERVELRLIADYRDANEDCCYPVTLNNDRDRRTTDIINGVLNPGSYSPFFLNPALPPYPQLGTQIDPPNAFGRKATSNRPTTQNVEEFGVSGELTVDFDNFTLTSITAYRDFESFRELDVDFTDADLLFNDRTDTNQIFTQEVRLQGVSGKLDWLFGAFYSSEDIKLNGSLIHGADYLSFIDQRLGNLVLVSFLEGQPLATAFGTTAFTVADLAAAGFSPYTALSIAGGAAPGGWANGTGAIGDRFSSDNTSFSIFTHNVYNVTEKLDLILGFRYNWDKKKAVSVLNNDPANTPGCIGIRPWLQAFPNFATMELLGPSFAGDLRRIKDVMAALGCVGITSPAFPFDITQKENEWNGIAGLSYQLSEDVMVYAHASRGYKAGGINLDRAGTVLTLVGDNTDPLNFLSPEFDAEIVKAVELGIKTSLPDQHMTINIAAFYNDYDNFQLNTFTGFNFQPETIEKVTSKGFEVEVTAAPTSNLQIMAGAAYTKADYGKNITDLSNILVNQRGLRVTIPGVLEATPLPEISPLAGQQLTNAPRWVLTGALTYARPMFAGGEIEGFLHSDFRYSSSFNTGSDLDPEKLQESFAIFNVRGGIRAADGTWQIDLWAKNVFNKDYHQIAFDLPLQANAAYGTFLADPRTWGVSVKGRF